MKISKRAADSLVVAIASPGHTAGAAKGNTADARRLCCRSNCPVKTNNEAKSQLHRVIPIADGLAIPVCRSAKTNSPDLRIEFENDAKEIERVNLKLATREYRSQELAAKAQAGSRLYAQHQDSDRLRRVMDQQEITARIFAFMNIPRGTLALNLLATGVEVFLAQIQHGEGERGPAPDPLSGAGDRR